MRATASASTRPTSQRPASPESVPARAADDDFHERPAAALNDCKASVVLSGYDSTAYDDLYPAGTASK